MSKLTLVDKHSLEILTLDKKILTLEKKIAYDNSIRMRMLSKYRRVVRKLMFKDRLITTLNREIVYYKINHTSHSSSISEAGQSDSDCESDNKKSLYVKCITELLSEGRVVDGNLNSCPEVNFDSKFNAIRYYNESNGSDFPDLDSSNVMDNSTECSEQYTCVHKPSFMTRMRRRFKKRS